MPADRTNPNTRQRLLEVGAKAFLYQGYHGTGLKAILDEAGVPKGSFYNYFDSKEDFASATIQHYASCMGGRLERALRGHTSPIAGLRAFFQAEADAFEKVGFIGGCLIANLGAELDDSPICRETLQSSMNEYLQVLTEVVASAQVAREIRNDIEASELASLLSDAWEGAVIRMKVQKSLAPLHQVLDRFLDGFLRP